MLARLLEDKGREAFETQAERISWHPDLGARFVGVFDGGWTESPAMIDAASLPPKRWTVVSLCDDAGAAGNYYVWRTRVGAFPVVLGVDLSAVAHTESVFMRALLGTGIVMTIGFMVLGRVASRAAQGKLDAVGDILDSVADGNTQVRVPLHATNDRIAGQINGHLDRLSALQTARRNSAAAIVNDLKRPLGRATVMVDRAPAGSCDGAVAAPVFEELMGLCAIFDSVLRIARIDAERGCRLRGRRALGDLVREMGETYAPVAEDAGQSLSVDRGPPGMVVAGDPGMLMQMVSNLLHNAITCGAQGNAIALIARAGNTEPVLEASDTGPGIPEDDRERVFTPFVRGDAARTTEGTGPGLTLVRAVAVHHGTTLRLSDAGLRVTVGFPPADPS